MGSCIVIHMRRDTSVVLIEGLLICHLYFVLTQSSLAQVQVTACKQCSHLSNSFLACFCSDFRPFLDTLEVQSL